MILHHWDTDGITSAAIFIRVHGDDELFTPKIGNFYLDSEDFSHVVSRERVIILDMNLPDAERICNHADVYIYDHHRSTLVKCAREHYNPFLEGKYYPSCTTVLMRRFRYNPDYLVALGIVGDMGPKSREIEEWEIVEKVLLKHGLEFSDIQRAVDLLDSSFKLDKREEVIENVHLVLQGLDAVLESSGLQRNLDVVNREIERWVDKAEDRGNYYFLRMSTRYHIISAVTRRLAWIHGKSALVINRREDRDEIYVRSPDSDFNAIPLIDMARGMGYRAGGKKEVMGAILPPNEGEMFATKILEVVGW